MSSQALTRATQYNQLAKESNVQIFTAIGAKAQQFKSQLPNGRVVIEILIETEERQNVVQRVAAISLEHNVPWIGEGKLLVDVSVHKYAEAKASAFALTSTASNASHSLVPTKKTSQGIQEGKLQCVDIFTDINFQDFQAGMDGAPIGPISPLANNVFQLLKTQVFPQGIPLPCFEKIVQTHLIVMTEEINTLQRNRIEWCTVRTVIGLWGAVSPTFGCGWSDGRRYDASRSGSEDLDDPSDGTRIWDFNMKELHPSVLTKFEEICDVAKGKRLPSSISPKATGTSMSTTIFIQDPTILEGKSQSLAIEDKK